jgi:hypothetical protein
MALPRFAKPTDCFPGHLQSTCQSILCREIAAIYRQRGTGRLGAAFPARSGGSFLVT